MPSGACALPDARRPPAAFAAVGEALLAGVDGALGEVAGHRIPAGDAGVVVAAFVLGAAEDVGVGDGDLLASALGLCVDSLRLVAVGGRFMPGVLGYLGGCEVGCLLAGAVVLDLLGGVADDVPDEHDRQGGECCDGGDDEQPLERGEPGLCAAARCC